MAFKIPVPQPVIFIPVLGEVIFLHEDFTSPALRCLFLLRENQSNPRNSLRALVNPMQKSPMVKDFLQDFLQTCPVQIRFAMKKPRTGQVCAEGQGNLEGNHVGLPEQIQESFSLG